MQKFVQILTLLNRKERFALLTRAFGVSLSVFDNQFLIDLSASISIHIDRIDYCAVDYHIDWIAAAVILHEYDTIELFTPQQIDSKLFKFTQEDTDMLIVFEANNKINIIFIEAKYDGRNDYMQMKKKSCRLENIKNLEGVADKFVFHYVLLSPHEISAKGVDGDELRRLWTWMRLRKQEHKIVSRCKIDVSGPVQNREGENWGLFEQ